MSQTYKLPKLITDLPDFEDLAVRAETDPLDLIDHCMRRSKEYDEGAHWMHWSVLISLYAAALVIARDPQLIAKLLNHACFKESPYRRNSKHVLRLTFLAGQGISTKGKKYKGACHDASMMQPFFKSQIEPIALFSMIQSQRGIKGLAEIIDPSDSGESGDVDNAAASEGSGGTKQPDDQLYGVDEPPVPADTSARPAERKIAKQSVSTSKINDGLGGDPVENAVVTIELQITKKRLDRLSRAPAGSTGHIYFERTEGGDIASGVKITSLRIDH